MAAAQGIEQGGERLTIALMGSISRWYPIESVFRVLDDFVKEHPDGAVSLDLIGVGGRDALEALLATKFVNLARHVSFTKRLPNDQMAMALANANAFLLFNMYAHSGTKIFDYLALRRRIILCYSDDPEARQLKQRHYNLNLRSGADEHVLEKIVEDTQSGVVVKDSRHLREVLIGLYREFAEKRSISCESFGTEKYSRKASVERLAGVLKGLME
jgi:hypothetical protein